MLTILLPRVIKNLPFAATLLCGLLIGGLAPAQAQDSGAGNSQPGAPTDDVLAPIVKRIAEQQSLVDELRAAPRAAILDENLVVAYVAQKQVQLIEDQLEFMKACAKLQPSQVSCRQQAAAWLAEYSQLFASAYSTPKDYTLPAEDASAADQAIGDARLFEQLALLDERDKLFVESLSLTEQLGIAEPEFSQLVKSTLSRRAATTAILLTRTLQTVDALKQASALLPKEESLKAKLTTSEGRARKLGTALGRLAALLDALAIDTREYEQLILASTGQLSTGTFSSGVFTRMLEEWSHKATEWVVEEGPSLVLGLLAFVIILAVAWHIARLAKQLISEALNRSRRPISQLLHRMIVNTAGNLIVAIGILIALSQIGISLGPLLAGVGVAGFVIGFALQDTLSNFASGVMILLYNPFDVGDVIETSGAFGKVSSMSLVNTTILTLDNQTIVVPNNKIWGEVIKNLTHQSERRVDMLFGIAYSADYEQAEQILQDIIDQNPMILDEPKPVIRMHELGDSSVNFVVRPWVKTENYWDVFWDTTKAVKQRFDAAGIEIPFPQRDVHLDASQPLMVRIDNAAKD